MTAPSTSTPSVLERRYSAAEFSFLTGISPTTLDQFLKAGIVSPSLQRAGGRGRGHVFDIADVAGARMMQALRIPNAAAAPLQQLVDFWHSQRGRDLIRELSTREREHEPRVVVVTEHGVEVDVDSRDVHARHGARVVFSVDVASFINDLVVMRVEDTILKTFPEPRASGRMPERGPRKRKKSKKKSSVPTERAGTKRTRAS